MDDTLRGMLDDVFSSDVHARNAAFQSLISAAEQPVDWAYKAWDRLVAGLRHKDNHVRAIAAQLLANLAALSDPERRIFGAFPILLAGTKDERFVTARHTLQSIWKVGIAGPAQQQLVLDGLAARFEECAAEKNCTLIRADIIQDLRSLYQVVKDDAIRVKAAALIESEPDLKYRKKYAGIWKP